MNASDVAVVLPARDEADAVEAVVHGFRAEGARVVVVDNASHDATAERARRAGADVVHEARPGYGSACLRGVRHLAANPPRIVVFADCDGTIDPHDLARVLAPLRDGRADLVLGSRTRWEPGAFPWHQRAGNRAVLAVLRLLFHTRLRDLPPLRAVRFEALDHLGLREPTYGLPVETAARALRERLRVAEVDVGYRRRRHGTSKVSGSLRRSLAAGWVMVRTALRCRFERRPAVGCVVVFARAPERGRVKTRLQARHDADAVLTLYRAFLQDTLRSARLSGARVVLAHTEAPDFHERRLADATLVQRGGTFGARFDDALRRAHRRGRPVMVIGADTPHLDPAAMRHALALARDGTTVIGPAPRGGFYLLAFPGTPVPVASVFDREDQVAALEDLMDATGGRCVRLPTLDDVDTPEDLSRLATRLRDDGWGSPATAASLRGDARTVPPGPAGHAPVASA